MPIKIIKNSGNAGVWSELLSGRTDLAKYYNAYSELVNGIPLPQGGVVKRSGSKFIAKTKEFRPWVVDVAYPVGCVVIGTVAIVDSYYYCNVAHTSGIGASTTIADDISAQPTYWTLVEARPIDFTTIGSKAKLFSFEFSTDDVHTLEFGTRYMRVFKNGARVFDSTTRSVSAITLPSGSPVVITTTASHGWTTGMTVKFSAVEGTTELNGKEYTITYKDADEFYLDGTDGDDFTAWTSLGTISKIYEITTPYNSAEVFELHKTQSADVMYIAHEDFPPYTLSRLGDANWTLAATVFTNGPFLSENTDALGIITFKTATLPTLKYSLVGTTGTLVASGTVNGVALAPFLALHVGSLWSIKHSRKDNIITTAYNDTNAIPTTLNANCVRIKGAFSFTVTKFNATSGTDSCYLWRKEGNGEWTQYEPFLSASSYSSTEKFDNVYYCWTRSAGSALVGNLIAKDQTNKGVVKITGFTNTTTVTVEVMTAVYNEDVAADSYDSPTSMWAEGAWNDYRGYPRTNTFYEDRLYWAGTTYNPQTIWGSASGEYLSHLTGDLDSDALVLPLNANDVSQIQWIVARKTMVAGTASTEFIISASNPDDPLTAIDKKASPQSYIGSNNLQPVILNNGLFYFQRQGKKLNVMTFAYEIDSYKSDNATLFANHILEESSPTTMAVQLTPDPCLWITREDGNLCVFVYEPGEEVFAAWSKCVTGSNLLTPFGYYESCAVVHGTDEDELWTIVKRVINNVAYRYIELSAPRYVSQADEAMMLDSAIVVGNPYVAQNITMASDTIRWDEGNFDSGLWY
jgi:hypothetical protein